MEPNINSIGDFSKKVFIKLIINYLRKTTVFHSEINI
jgi:hypothetical protein